jgi:hypothetical protein
VRSASSSPTSHVRGSGDVRPDRLAGVHGQPAIGHFFFEPKGYDKVNRATHEYKEDIKVGYNLRRKVILHAVWALSPVVLWFDPTFFGLFPAHTAGRSSCATWGRSGSSSASAHCCSARCSCSS